MIDSWLANFHDFINNILMTGSEPHIKIKPAIDMCRKEPKKGSLSFNLLATSGIGGLEGTRKLNVQRMISLVGNDVPHWDACMAFVS